MADREVGVLIVGGGAAADACAATLRAEGYAGPVLVCTREAEAPYERPACSKGYLRGTVAREEIALRAPGFHEREGIGLALRASVMKLDPAARTARLSTREEIAYEHVVLATGANVRRLPIEGAALDGLHYLRAPGNADAIRADAAAVDAAEVVLVGGSYLACEVAASLTADGRRCTLVMTEDLPLSAHFGDAAGRFFADRLDERSIAWTGGETVAGFAPGDDPDRVARVVTASGREFAADLVVLGTGAVPDVMLARATGLGLGATGGVLCDERLAVAGAEGVWAAGDMCEYASVLHGGTVRIEHWELARAHGAHVARGILGATDPFAEVPYFWSDLGDWLTLEAAGRIAGHERATVDPGVGDGSLLVRYERGGRETGVLAVGEAAQTPFAAARSMLGAGPSS